MIILLPDNLVVANVSANDDATSTVQNIGYAFGTLHVNK